MEPRISFSASRRRHIVIFFAAGLLISLTGPGSFAKRIEPARQQIEAALGGGLISSASPEQLVSAVNRAVAANPGAASAILTEALSATRSDRLDIAGRCVGAAITGLGPQPDERVVTFLVGLAVVLETDSLLEIVKEAVRVTPQSMATAIVKAAVAATRNATKVTVKEVARAAIQAQTAQQDGKEVIGKEITHLEDPTLEAAGAEGLSLSYQWDPISYIFQQTLIDGGPAAIPPIPPDIPRNPRSPSR